MSYGCLCKACKDREPTLTWFQKYVFDADDPHRYYEPMTGNVGYTPESHEPGYGEGKSWLIVPLSVVLTVVFLYALGWERFLFIGLVGSIVVGVYIANAVGSRAR